jgi:hypothetical protein
MSQEIADTWYRVMTGQDLAIELFVQKLIEVVLRTGLVKAAVKGPDRVEIEDGMGAASEITDFAASGKFRMICARLAVIFGTASNTPPKLYGGGAVAQLQFGETRFDAELTHLNAPNGWFAITKKN